MRSGPATLSAVVVLLLAAGLPGDEARAQPIERSFEPLWSPPAGELRGWTVGIDPLSPDGGDRAEARCGQFALITALHLYHMVSAAGGTPVLTRADDTHAADVRPPTWKQRTAPLRQAECDVCVSITFGSDARPRPPREDPASDRPLDVLLADAMRAALTSESPAPDVATIDADLVRAADSGDQLANAALCEVRFHRPATDSTIGPEVRKACRENARRLYTGIRRYCAERAPRHRPPDETSLPDGPATTVSERWSRIAHSIWPRDRLPDELIDWFCQTFAQVSITNRSLVCFEVSAHREQTVVLRGRTTVPRVAAGLVQALRAVGIEHVRNDVRTLPDQQHLGQQLFGVCRVPAALTYAQPDDTSGLQTQLLFGETLFLLDSTAERYLLHAGDGYWGWVDRAAVEPMTAERFRAYTRLPRATALRDIDRAGVRIPCGSIVRVLRADADQRVIRLPSGSTISVPAAAVSLSDAGSSAEQRVRAALEFMYVPYLFGGRSPLGIDCSGFVTSVWARGGGTPSRDAWQQAFAGHLVATRWYRAGIQRGDQLFFINQRGKIYHTAIALDAVRFVHAAPPCVQIGSLDPRDPLYDQEADHDFLLAKRP